VHVLCHGDFVNIHRSLVEPRPPPMLLHCRHARFNRALPQVGAAGLGAKAAASP
jgi:hypothetical protein